MQVCVLPGLSEFKNEVGGVARCVLDFYKYLPRLGVSVTSNPDEADVIHAHAVNWHPLVDIYTNHGFWARPNTDWEERATARMRRLITAAKITTSVSEWSPRIYSKELGVTPRIIRNGVPVRSLRHTHKGKILAKYGLDRPYFLWGKNLIRQYNACRAVIELAQKLPDWPFVTTFIPHGIEIPPNVIITGTVPYKVMKMMIRDCYAMIGTERECFSIQILEALAMGKPVIGWNWGGTPEVIKSGYNGYIGEVDSPLVDLVPNLVKNYDELSANAAKTGSQFDLETCIMPQYIACYDEIMMPRSPIKVSIIITCYNLEGLIEKSVTSALSQEFTLPFEVIVVNDYSTDGSASVLDELQKRFPGLRVIHNQENMDVSPSRNKAIECSRGEYIVSLDGDDWMEPTFLQKLVPVMDSDRSLGVVYSDFTRFGDIDGYADCKEFDRDAFLRHNNVPVCNLFRKEAWRRAGGYRNLGGWEDYDLWIAIEEKNYGFAHIAEPLFHYRQLLSNRAFRSARDAPRLRKLIHELHPQYVGPTAEELVIEQEFLKRMAEEQAAIEGGTPPEVPDRGEPLDSRGEDSISSEIQEIASWFGETTAVDEPASDEIIEDEMAEEEVKETGSAGSPEPEIIEERCLLRYTADRAAPVTLYGASGKRYRFSSKSREISILSEDRDSLMKTGWFERIDQ